MNHPYSIGNESSYYPVSTQPKGGMGLIKYPLP